MVCWGCTTDFIGVEAALAAAGLIAMGEAVSVGTATPVAIAAAVADGIALAAALTGFVSCVAEKCPDTDIQWAKDLQAKVSSMLDYLKSL
jgi:hypothetical protein